MFEYLNGGFEFFDIPVAFECLDVNNRKDIENRDFKKKHNNKLK